MIIFLSLSGIINWFVDANGVFNNIKIEGFNKYKYKRTQGKVLFNATQNINEFDTIFFGTSRSALYGSNNLVFKKLKIINLSDIIYGYPFEIYQYIKFLVKKPNNIKNIFIGIDIHTMKITNNKIANLRNNFFYMYPKIMYFITKYIKLLPNVLPLTYLTVENNLNNKIPRSYMDNFGVRYYNIKSKKYKRKLNQSNDRLLSFENAAFEYLQKIEKLCKNNKIKVIFFTFPYSTDFYRFDYSYKNIIKLNRILPKYLNGYYNFSYLNKLTNYHSNYFDSGHQNYNFDKYLYNALILNKKYQKIDGKYIYKYIKNNEN